MNISYQSNTAGQADHAASGYSVEQSISFGNILYGVWKRKFLIVTVFALSMTCVVLWLSVAEPRYTPELRVLIENDENPFTQTQQNGLTRNSVDQNEVASQVQVLLSNDLARKVAADLDLANNPEFSSKPKESSLFTELFKMLGLHRDPTQQSVNQRVVEKYFQNLSVYPVNNSRVIVIEFTSSDPELAAKVTNAIGETYVLATRQVKFNAARDAMKWLSGEITRLRQTVASSEAAVEEFRARKGLFKTDNTTLDAQELAGINSQIILAAAARSEAEARARSIKEMLKSKGGVDGSAAVLDSTVIQNLREQQTTLQRTVADLESTYLPTHPRLKRLAAEIARLDAQIRKEALKIVESLENEAKIQASREAELRASLAKLKTKTSTSNQDEITLRALEREAEANRNLLQTFLQRYTEASARQDITALPAGARIISRAQVLGKPSFPKTKQLFMLGLVGSAVIAILLAFVAEVFSLSPTPVMPLMPAGRREPALAAAAADSVPMPAAAPAASRMHAGPELASAVPEAQAEPERPREAPVQLPDFDPVLEVLPSVTAGKSSLVEAGAVCVEEPLSEFALAVRRIYQKMIEAGHQSGSKRYTWTSGEDLEDKVPVLVNLARVFAQNGSKTIVIDTDFESDELVDAFQVSDGVGLAELLAGRAAFTDAIVRDPASGVHVLRQGQAREQAFALLGGKRMDFILDALEQAYEAVLINVAPMNEDAARLVAPKAGYSVVFADAGKNGKRAGASAMYALKTLGVSNMAGVTVQGDGILNRFLSKYRKAA